MMQQKVKSKLRYFAYKIEGHRTLTFSETLELQTLIRYIRNAPSSVQNKLKGKIEKSIIRILKWEPPNHLPHLKPNSDFITQILIDIIYAFKIKEADVFLFNVIITTQSRALRVSAEVALSQIKK